MKKSLFLMAFSFLVFSCGTSSKLSLNKTTKFNPSSSITVVCGSQDVLNISGKAENILLGKNFEVVSRDVAIEKSKTNRTNQSEESYKGVDIKSVYVLKFTYQVRGVAIPFTGKVEYVISELTGNITDLANNGKLVATYTYKPGHGYKDPEKIIEEIVNKLLS